MKVLRKLMFSVTIFSALIAPSFTYARYIDGNELKEWAYAHDRVVRRSQLEDTDFAALGRITGFVAALHDAVDGVLVCTTAGVSLGQVVAVAAKYIQEHPEVWNGPAYASVIVALQEAWPCPDSNP
jgi:hypothetical protein